MLVLDALSLNKTSRRPVWVMRQAGRYQKAFREIRAKHSFEEVCTKLELATEVTMNPIKNYDFDAAIIFSDILLPLKAMGAPLAYTDKGPVLEAPKTVAELNKLNKNFDPREGTPHILESLRAVREQLSPEKALLGFAGAPFTMLSYLLEGKLTKELKTMKACMAKEPASVHEWLKAIAEMTGDYLDAQANAGANAVQLFDTWAGVLSPEDYEEFALPYAREALSAVTVPCLYYVNGVSGILEKAAATGAQGLSIDWRMSMAEARRRVSSVVALQGNLDPYHLLLPRVKLREKVFEMCDSYGKGPGYIANLGHGIVPEIPEEAVSVFVESVREWSEANL